uniref:Uncharacterized protein n=1 Tax=Avena sativa TaxID=4498 RepID=A0ACD5Z4Y5_AVESA
MAEFALGLTKTAVEGTVSRVKSAIDEETKLRVRVQNDLVFITGEFQMMQSFLNVANKERVKNEVVRTWVRQIRDLAFDVEDCVELIVSLNVRSGWSWLWRVLPSWMAPPRLLDQAVSDLQRLKARVEDVSHRNTRYNLINDSGADSMTPAQVTNVVPRLLATELLASDGAMSSSSPFHILREVWEAAGKIRHDMADLKKLITNGDDNLEVISLWGGQGSAADLAKTHVIREVYSDPEVCQAFKSRAWLKVMHPFNLDEFLNSLVTQFYASSQRAKVLVDAKIYTKMRAVMAGEDNLMKAQLMRQVSEEQRYLVIVEALCTVAEWDTIRMYLPDSKNGSRIVTTTQQLGLAVSCTGNPYQVSELRQFSSGQSLCAFYSKIAGHRNDIGELICQIRDGGVISVWRFRPSNSTLIHEVYKAITHKSNVFEGVDFDRHNWVNVSEEFDLGVFSRRMFFNFHSDDLRAKKILAAGIMGDTRVIEGCRKFLHEDHCLIVINGLKSIEEWDLIKSAFQFEPTKCCILITTMNQYVAKHCVDEDNRTHDFQDLDADTILRHTIKRSEYYGSEGSEASNRGHFFSNRKQEARDWINKFGLFTDPRDEYSSELGKCLKELGVISLCGTTTGAWKSALARKIYYKDMLIIASEDDMLPKCNTDVIEIVGSGFTKYSWVDVPHPFNLMDFCWRLFLDFHSDDIEAKQTVAFDMMKGCQDPVQGCLKLLHQHKCFVVIDGLESRDDWDLIKNLLLARPTKGCILVITNEQNVATHCVPEEDRVVFTHGQDLKVASHPLIKVFLL